MKINQIIVNKLIEEAISSLNINIKNLNIIFDNNHNKYEDNYQIYKIYNDMLLELFNNNYTIETFKDYIVQNTKKLNSKYFSKSRNNNKLLDNEKENIEFIVSLQQKLTQLKEMIDWYNWILKKIDENSELDKQNIKEINLLVPILVNKKFMKIREAIVSNESIIENIDEKINSFELYDLHAKKELLNNLSKHINLEAILDMQDLDKMILVSKTISSISNLVKFIELNEY